MSFLGNRSCCPAVATVCPADLGQRGFPQLPGRCRRPARGGAGGRGLRRRARVPRRPLAICRWTWSLVDLEAQGWLGLWVRESASVLDSTQDKVFWIKKKNQTTAAVGRQPFEKLLLALCRTAALHLFVQAFHTAWHWRHLHVLPAHAR